MKREPFSCMLIVMVFFLFAECFAQNQGEELSSPENLTAEHSVTVPYVDEIIKAIEEFTPPFDSEQIKWIIDAISKQTSQEDKEMLQEKLDARLKNLLNNTDSKGISEEPSKFFSYNVEEIRQEILALQFGPEATVDDLRKRDELVAKITTISDPDVQYNLLQLLEDRECNKAQ